jgi:hypothetical protein
MATRSSNRTTTMAAVIAFVLATGLAACAPRSSAGDATATSTTTSTTSTTSTTTTTTTLPPPTVGLRAVATNPWYQQVPADAPIDPVGYGYGQEIADEIVQYYQHASLNDHNYTPSVYVVGPDQPTVPIVMWNCQSKGPTAIAAFNAMMAAVPVPSDAVIPADSDASIVVWQPSTDTVWETWKTQFVSGEWQACWGGKLTNASQNIGTYPYPYGASASGITQLAGLITPDELAAGHIDHAIALGVVHTRKVVISWPANRTDGGSTLPFAIPEGQRLRLDPTVDLSTYKLTPVGRMVAVALQKYGAFVRESSGSVTVYAQNANTWTAHGLPDPYKAIYGSTPHYALLDGIPWDKLQALPLNYGKP